MASTAAGRVRTVVFAPLGDPGRAARVERRLTDAIRTGVLGDGERLPSEAELARMLGVSTVTTREALAALRSRGLLTTTRGRGGGSFVSRQSDAEESLADERLRGTSRFDVHDQGVAYAVVVAGAAELAAERASAQEAAALGDLVLPPEETDPTRWRHADAELTMSIAGLTQSPRVTREVMRREADFGVLLRLPFADSAVRATTRAYHLALIRAIAEAEAGLARSLVRTRVEELLHAIGRRHAGLS